MQNEPSSNDPIKNDSDPTPTVAEGNGVLAPGPDCGPDPSLPGDQITPPPPDKSENGGDNRPGKEPTPEPASGQKENRVDQVLNRTQADLVGSFVGDNSKFDVRHSTYNYISPADAPSYLDVFITTSTLESTKRSYKSLGSGHIAGYAAALLTNRILLLSCYHSEVALNIAKSIAYENKSAQKKYVTIEKNCQGTYTLNNLIGRLACREEDGDQSKTKTSRGSAPTVWVWAANDISEGDTSNSILDSLFADGVQIEQSQNQLRSYQGFLICLVTPQKIEEYRRSRVEIAVRTWEIDFLRPLLEEYELHQYDELAETIIRQRQETQWSDDNAEFYKEVGNHLRQGKLPEVVAGRSDKDRRDGAEAEQLFSRQIPLHDTVLYCATYFSDLSPQDFSSLVELFLGDATEEVTRKINRARTPTENELVEIVEAVPLVRRWHRETDVVLRSCKLTAVKNESNERVVDFQIDGLRSRLSQLIESDHYFFYESLFSLIRRQGLLFSSRKKIAEGARQLLVEMATQYAPSDVANWLYEIVTAFEKMASDGPDLPSERPPLFSLLPDGKVRTSRHLVCYGLSLALTRLNKEPELREAVRIFWQRLLQTHHQWFLDLLRRMGNSPPAETLPWLKQMLDQGTEEIRVQVCSYLVGYLLRRDSVIYQALKEIMLWSKTSEAGRSAKMLVVVYFTETNRRLAQGDYGRWPSLHPLFGFQKREEAGECMGLLIKWLIEAAIEVHDDDGPYFIADILAGWYFILSPPSRSDSPDEAIVVENAAELDAQTVREILLTRLAKHITREQKSALLTIWEDFKTGIQEEMFQLDKFVNQISGVLLNAKLMNNAKTARNKLQDTRILLSQLRKDFIRCAAEVSHG